MPRDPVVLARELLGSSPDSIEPLVVWSDRATHRVEIGTDRFVVKTDDDLTTVAREVRGQQRAASAGVAVPEIVAVREGAFAMRWVDGVELKEVSEPAAWHATGAQIRLTHDLGGDRPLPFGTGFGGFAPGGLTWRTFFESFAEHMLVDCERDLGFPAPAAARVRDALHAAAPLLDAAPVVWCHGDFQPDHVLVDPATNRIVAIIDWADNGSGDPGWDVCVLTLDHNQHRDAFLSGYGATDELRAALEQLLPIYDVVRLLGSASWLAEHDHPLAPEHLRRALEWHAP